MTAASAYLSTTTINLAEYTGMNWGIQAALDHNVTDLIIVVDSRLAIQQSVGLITCKKDSLQVQLAHHKKLVEQFYSVRYLHVMRCYTAAADTLATGALETKTGQVIEDHAGLKELQALNRIQEKLLIDSTSVKDRRETPAISATTQSATRRVQLRTLRLWDGVTCQVPGGIGRAGANKHQSCLE